MILASIANRPQPQKPDAERWTLRYQYWQLDYACWKADRAEALLDGVIDDTGRARL